MIIVTTSPEGRLPPQSNPHGFPLLFEKELLEFCEDALGLKLQSLKDISIFF